MRPDRIANDDPSILARPIIGVGARVGGVVLTLGGESPGGLWIPLDEALVAGFTATARRLIGRLYADLLEAEVDDNMAPIGRE